MLCLISIGLLHTVYLLHDVHAGGGAFGQSQPATGFGAQQSASAFGQQQQGGFGFGSGGGAFGQQPQQSSASLFGQQPAQAGGGLFGQQQSGGGLFGSQPAASPFGQQSTSAFGAQSPGLFGQQSQQQQQQGAAPFGNQSSSSLFGGGTAFGQANSQAKPAGLFGQPAQQGGGLFGQSSSSLFSGSSFGFGAQSQQQQQTQQPQQQQQQQSGGGLFGNQQAGGGLFGQNAGNQAGGLFGPTQAAGGGLFGGATQSSAAGSSLFGTPAGGAGGGLFGSGGAFGGVATSSPGLFGGGGAASSAGMFNATSGSSLFGGAGGAGVFGQAPAAANAGALAVQPVSPGQVSPYGALPALPQVPELKSANEQALTNGVRIAARPADAVDVMPHFWQSPMLRAPSRARRAPAAALPALDEDEVRKPFARRAPSLFKADFRDSSLVIQQPLPSTEAAQAPPVAAQTAGTSGGSPPAAPTNGRTDFSPPGGHATTSSRQTSASPAAAAAAPRAEQQSTPPVLDGQRACSSAEAGPSAGGSAAQRRASAPRSRTKSPAAAAQALSPATLPQVPDSLYTHPPLSQLRLIASDPEALKAVHHFTVGREGVGEVMYLAPVDISDAPDIGATFSFAPGHVSAFEGTARKPDVGAGLNKPARVQLHLDGGCLDKIVKKRKSLSPEEQIAKVTHRLQRLCVETDSTFVSLDFAGENPATWVFEVKHWSRCGSSAALSLRFSIAMESLQNTARHCSSFQSCAPHRSQ